MGAIVGMLASVLVFLGGPSAKTLLGLNDSMGQLRSHSYEFRGARLFVTYHPAYLLRNQALSERRRVWEDMLQVMGKLGMPISQKQQNFFLKPA